MAIRQRPTPTSVVVVKRDRYDGEDLRIYRLRAGVTQWDLSRHVSIQCAQPLIAHMEKLGADARWAERLFAAVDDITARRERLVAEGEARAKLRDARAAR